MNLLNYYLYSELEKAGFPQDLELRYSFSYDYRDGVGFYGVLSPEDCSRLYRIMNPSMSDEAYIRFDLMIDCLYERDFFEIKKSQESPLCDNYNTMYLVYDFDWCSIELLKELASRFEEELSQYIIETSKKLTQLGYELYQKSWFDETYRRFQTKTFEINIYIRPFGYLSNDWLEHFYYDEDEQDVLDKILNEDYFLYDLDIEIKDRLSGNILAQKNEQIFITSRYLRYYRNLFVSEAIIQVRELKKTLMTTLKTM